MNVSDSKRQLGPSGKQPFVIYFWLSMLFHTTLIVGMAVSARWLHQPRPYTFSSHTVSLVDAPLTLTKQPASQGAKIASDTTAKPASPPQAPQTKPTAVAATPSAAPLTKAKASEKTKRQHVPSTSSAKKVVKESPPPEQAKVQQPTTPSRQDQAAPVKTKTEQIRQRKAEQRLAALRARYGSQGESITGTKVTENLQRVRLRAYQEFVRERVVEAWILPLQQDTVRNLQATALLTVDREGRIAKLELLQASNNPLFDESLLRAIRQVEPLPALPEDYGGTFLELELHFKLGTT